MENQIKRTERGWAGHFICADRCLFHRNTLIEYNDIAIVISTVGNMRNFHSPKFPNDIKIDTIGCDRYFETMVFHANEDEWQDANASKQINTGLNWVISEAWKEKEANNMHEESVDYIIQQLLIGNKFEVVENE